MWKGARPWIPWVIIGVVSSILASGILWFLFWTSNNLLQSIMGTLAVALAAASAFLCARVQQIHRRLVQCPDCCGLRIGGFCGAFDKASHSLPSTLERASSSYRFLGVSAQFVLGEPEFPALIERPISISLINFLI